MLIYLKNKLTLEDLDEISKYSGNFTDEERDNIYELLVDSLLRELTLKTTENIKNCKQKQTGFTDPSRRGSVFIY